MHLHFFLCMHPHFSFCDVCCRCGITLLVNSLFIFLLRSVLDAPPFFSMHLSLRLFFPKLLILLFLLPSAVDAVLLLLIQSSFLRVFLLLNSGRLYIRTWHRELNKTYFQSLSASHQAGIMSFRSSHQASISVYLIFALPHRTPSQLSQKFYEYTNVYSTSQSQIFAHEFPTAQKSQQRPLRS